MTTKFICSTPILIVNDAAKARDFYVNKLGFEVSFEWGEPPIYVGLHKDGVEIHLNSASNAPHEAGRGELSISTDEVDQLYEQCVQHGVEIMIAPGNREYGMRDFGIKDLDGNAINFGCELQDGN
ncbi:MAG: glyoxalase superfamily protein [Pseudomonadota bacterium]